MSWVTVIWSMIASACLAVAATHLVVWRQRRSEWALVFFALIAAGTAGLAFCELLAMRATTPDQFASAWRWRHVPVWIIVLAMVGFVRTCLRAGRSWLAWTVCAAWTSSLLLNFVAGANLDYREVVGLRHVLFLGESISLGEGAPNPWLLVGPLSLLLLAVFVTDAAITVWRRGDRRVALTAGGGITLFVLVVVAETAWMNGGLACAPMTAYCAFAGVAAVAVWELSVGAARAARLANDLRDNEARYRDIFDGAVEGMFRSSEAGKLLVANAALARMLGYDSAEAMVREVEDTAQQVWAEPQERGRFIRQAAERGSVGGYECQFKRRDGTRIWVSLSVRVSRGSDGRIACLDGFVEDVSERRLRADALRVSEARVASAIDVAGIGFCEMDGSTRITFPDRRTCLLMGLPPEDEKQGREWWLEHIHPEDLPRVLQKSREILEAGRAEVETEYRYVHPSRGVLWIHQRSRILERNADGRPVRVLSVLQDVTARKEAEAAIRRSQDRLASATELAGLGFYELLNGEDVTYVDERVRALCGLPPDMAQGAPARRFWLEHIHPDDRPLIQGATHKLDGGAAERISLEYRYQHPDGRERWIQHLATVTERAGGRARQIIGVVRDITETKRAALELTQQRVHLAHVARVSTMGQLASSLAHELNQPLGAILRNAEAAELVLQEPSPDLDEVRAILSDIREDDQRAGEVIDRMRGMLKRREPERRPLDLCLLASDVIALLRQDADMRGVRLIRDPCPEVSAVIGDRVQLQQVVLNLVLNAMEALDANPPGKRVVTARIRCAGGTVAFSVSDNGPGIPPGNLSRIFDPFMTTKPHGIGMGLAISRDIVEAHGGRLWVEHNAGGGATFTFSLSAAEGESGGGAGDAGRRTGEAGR